ncbi:MAG: LrgB family protein [Oscillospiraceae bacterium]|nr:LrgB family protein [Oscillospiraceae bacterium]
MNNLILSSTTFGVVISVFGFIIGMELKKRFKTALFNPLLIAILLVIAVLKLCHIDYSNYNASAKYLSYWLTPATVCLAVPLYAQIEKLRQNLVAILCALTVGALTSLVSVLILASLFRLSHQEYVTLLPKSVTSAIGMGISEELGGYSSVTVAVIILSGIFGNVSGDLVCRVFRITEPIAKGLGMGAASHAIGTVRAMEWGELEGAMSSLAIVVSGLLTVIGASFFAKLL